MIDVATTSVTARIDVGVDPVSVVPRPDGSEIWVANHVSDTVSVIDTDPSSDTFHQVIATVQDIEPDVLSTRFDEPVGIAFANDGKAYVALSTSNRIAVVDVASRTVTGHLPIAAQDPRAIAVRGNRAVRDRPSSPTTGASSRAACPGTSARIPARSMSWSMSSGTTTCSPPATTPTSSTIPGCLTATCSCSTTETDEQVEVVTGIGTLL